MGSVVGSFKESVEIRSGIKSKRKKNKSLALQSDRNRVAIDPFDFDVVHFSRQTEGGNKWMDARIIKVKRRRS